MQYTSSIPAIEQAANILGLKDFDGLGEVKIIFFTPAALAGPAAIKTDDAGKSSFEAVRGSAGFIGTVSARYTKMTYRNEIERGLGFTIRF